MEYRTTPTPTLPEFLRRKEVCALTDMSSTTIWRLTNAGKFPSAVSLSPRTRVWVKQDVHRWLDERIAQARHRGGA